MTFSTYLDINNTTVETYFDKIMRECKDFDELPRELVNCNCCARHKINFPTLECKLPTSNEPILSDKTSNSCECECPCRHIARHICREWDVLNEVEDIYSDEEISEDSDEETSYNSMDDFIVEDDEKEFKFTKKARRELRNAIELFKSKNTQK